MRAILEGLTAPCDTGIYRFGEADPCIIIGNQDAAYYTACLQSVLDGNPSTMDRRTVADLVELLRESNVTWRERHSRPAIMSGNSGAEQV